MKIGEFDFEEVPIYTTHEGDISFIPNSSAGPGAYDVVINRETHFYIPDRTLPDLIGPGVSAKSMMRCLEVMCGDVEIVFKLFDNNISPERLQVELLRLKIKEQEKELERAYEEAFGDIKGA